ncbi:MAG: Uncharacterized protein XD78_0572 [Desulfotomaculum sp. 46_296]|nr:MAG: Uncharacterized protein XD78_0572 [Desulfotomaculum sp. 46_296]HAU31550.1 hypothetical protein [Desulfotomaculum sp.]
MKKILLFLAAKYFLLATIVFFYFTGCFHSHFYKPEFSSKQTSVYKSNKLAKEILLKKFTVSEILRFKRMAKDGLSPGEIKQIDKALRSRLSRKDYEKIRLIFRNKF